MPFLFLHVALGTLFLIAPFHVVRAQSDYMQQLMQNRRYEVRPSSKPSQTKRAPASEEAPVVAIPAVVEEKKAVQVTPAVTVTTTVVNSQPAEPVTESQPDEPKLGDQFKALYGDEHRKVLDFYEQRLDEHDPRRNKVEVQVAPGWSYTQSRSSYSPRDYHTSYPSLRLRANVWLTPAIGLVGQLQFSMGASLPGDSTIDSRDTTRFETVDLGIRFRSFQEYSKGSSSQEVGLFFIDDSTQVASDSLTRLKLRSTGFGIGVWSRNPAASGSSAWHLGGGFAPRMVHVEDATGWTGQSGSPLENIRMLLEVSREEILSRKSQILYGIKWTGERNAFDGAATAADPLTGLTPTNVSVTNSTATFFFGYRWGH